MKFTKVRLTGLNAIDLPIEGALPSDPYILQSADGLGPPEVDVSIAATLNTGGVYQGRRPQNRFPVFLIGLNPDYSIGQTASEMRSSLYGMLTPGYDDTVRIDLIDVDTVVATTVGYVSKIEITPFSKDPQVQVSMECLQPYLEAPNLLYIIPGGSKAAPEIQNEGTASTGFHMELTFNSGASSWVLTDTRTGKKMEFIYDFIAGDKLTFDTRPGSRSVSLTRDLATSSIIYTLTALSSWHMLYGGLNMFSTNFADFEWGDVYYQPKYWGI